MVVFPVPEGAETTNSSPRSGGRLLDILDLLPYALELGLGGDDDLGGARALGLGPDGVDLAVHLLHEEVELAPAGLVAAGERAPVLEMPFQARDLFVDVRPRD